MSAEDKNIFFIVVDPSQDEPLALKRALSTAKRAEDVPGQGTPVMHVFLAVDFDNTDTSAENPAVHRDGDWFFEQIINPLELSGVEFKLELSWCSDWYGSIINGAKKHQPQMILLPMVARPSSHERIFNESVWRLLRTVDCPVLIVQPGSPEERNKVLAAVNFQSHKPEYQLLNDVIIGRSQWIASLYSADLHFVNAYSDSLNYPDRTQLANKTAVDTAHIHVTAGAPDEVIADTVKSLGVDLVVLGIRNRSSRWRGNTAEKIITQVNCDILAINQS